MGMSRRLRAGFVISVIAGVLTGVCCAVGWAVALFFVPALSGEPGAPSILGAFVRFGLIGAALGAAFATSAALSAADRPDQRIAAARASIIACIAGPLVMLVVVPLLSGRALLWSIALPIIGIAVLGAGVGTLLVADVRRRALAPADDHSASLAP